MVHDPEPDPKKSDFWDLDEEDQEILDELREDSSREWLIPEEWLDELSEDDEDDTRDQRE